MFLWDVKDLGLTGNKVEKILEWVYIFANKNSIKGDKNPMSPGGLRIGTPAMTSWGFKEAEIKILAGFIERAINLAKLIHEEHKPKDLKIFVSLFEDAAYKAALDTLQHEVREFTK